MYVISSVAAKSMYLHVRMLVSKFLTHFKTLGYHNFKLVSCQMIQPHFNVMQLKVGRTISILQLFVEAMYIAKIREAITYSYNIMMYSIGIHRANS